MEEQNFISVNEVEKHGCPREFPTTEDLKNSVQDKDPDLKFFYEALKTEQEAPECGNKHPETADTLNVDDQRVTSVTQEKNRGREFKEADLMLVVDETKPITILKVKNIYETFKIKQEPLETSTKELVQSDEIKKPRIDKATNSKIKKKKNLKTSNNNDKKIKSKNKFKSKHSETGKKKFKIKRESLGITKQTELKILTEGASTQTNSGREGADTQNSIGKFSDFELSQSTTEVKKKIKKKTKCRRLQEHGKNNEEKYFCDICAKVFTVFKYLCNHVISHFDSLKYRCPYCTKLFAHRGHLNVHIRIHTGERPFLCEICNIRFIDSGKMTVHKRIHNREKHFKCSCGKSFAQSCTLVMHKRGCGKVNFNPDELNQKKSKKKSIKKKHLTGFEDKNIFKQIQNSSSHCDIDRKNGQLKKLNQKKIMNETNERNISNGVSDNKGINENNSTVNTIFARAEVYGQLFALSGLLAKRIALTNISSNNLINKVKGLNLSRLLQKFSPAKPN